MERPVLQLPNAETRASSLFCCCGRLDCAFLKKNYSVLEAVEKDVHTAAQLGQALLARHEAYMVDAERDRLDLTKRIERLEMDKQELEAENAFKIEENRNLLDQLELLNTSVSDSDTKIRALEANLLSSQQAVRRLETAAAHAADAERHLAVLELEQEQLHKELRLTKEDARSQTQRFKEAQRGILDMQDQLDKMESEAHEERKRHAEVMARMERQREVEKQLDAAADRLKGAAASKRVQESKSGSAVVGHFVRDLLQDNANLQLGMAELRELLFNSNDEIQSLREQLEYHQPMPEPSRSRSSQSLKAELDPVDEGEFDNDAITPTATPRVSQELHIHHHYHVSSKQEPRKPKKKRHSLTQAAFASPSVSGTSTPVSSGMWRLGHSPTPSAVLSLASAMESSNKARVRQSWSTSSEHPNDFASSVPSSPRSNKRNSMFDSSYFDGDVPTSPATSFDPMSPTWRASHRKGPSEISSFSYQPSLTIDPGTPPNTQTSRPSHLGQSVIHEEEEGATEDGSDYGTGLGVPRLETPDLLSADPSVEENSTVEGSDMSGDEYMFRPRIHRTVSHESILSLTGGLDIHTLKARPSQLTLRPLGGAEAVVTGVIAQPTLSRGPPKRSALALRDSFAGLPSSRAVSSPIAPSISSHSSSVEERQGGSGGGALSKLAGWRPWGGSSTPKASDKDSSSSISKDRDREEDFSRAPGINQPGSIPGFQKYWAAQKRKGAPAKVTVESIDHNALAEGLNG